MKILDTKTSCGPAQNFPPSSLFAGQTKQVITILGIESSCDETSVSVVKGGQKKIKILSNIVSSQINLHKKYGGVYPELASRAHLENIIPCIRASLEQAKIGLDNIDLIAVTSGPGLIGSLLVGVNTAKTLAYALDKPIMGINHLEGHIYANFADGIPDQTFPAIALIVSGGHTCLVLMKNQLQYKIIGQTRDDASGEAFDKVAQILGLTYPGGPAIEAAAYQMQKAKRKTQNLKIKLPRPMIDSADFDFSFSGLKTAVLYLVKQLKDGRLENVRREIAYEVQKAVTEVLIEKTIKAARQHEAKSILLSGGVAANAWLRREFELAIKKLKIKFFVPPKILCTDNAAMIAIAAYYKSLKKQPSKWYNIFANANAKLA